jgi:DNA-binding NarL/FixJ family response regulator
MKILLIDDHALIIDAMSALLLDFDPPVDALVARDAQGAIDLLRANFDAQLMLLDLGLPGATGTSVLERVLLEAPTLKVLVMSGTQDHRTITRVLQLGAVGFLPKSMASDALVAAIRFVLGGGVYIPRDLLADGPRPGPRAAGLATAQATQRAPGRAILSERHEQVLQWLAQGASIKVICQEMNLSEGTVKMDVTAIYRVFKATNRTQALAAARRQGYVIF